MIPDGPIGVKLNNTHSTKVKIKCTPPNGYPSVMVSWRYKVGNRTMIVEEDDRFKIKERWLTINNVQLNDTGLYQCVASNDYFERSSVFIFLDVQPSK